jgi:hypothetical protein
MHNNGLKKATDKNRFIRSFRNSLLFAGEKHNNGWQKATDKNLFIRSFRNSLLFAGERTTTDDRNQRIRTASSVPSEIRCCLPGKGQQRMAETNG